MNENLTYQKDFSPLPGLQQQRSLRYSLICETSAAGECFGIQVEESSDDTEESIRVEPFTGSRITAERLLIFLCENAVPVSHCREIVAEAYSSVAAVVESGRENYGRLHDPAIDRGR